MYTRILVPLDGSRFAEQALPHALNIAAAGAVEIHLLSVAPLLDDQTHSVVDMYPVYVYRDYMVNHASESERIKLGLQDYLDQVVRGITAAGHQATSAVRRLPRCNRDVGEGANRPAMGAILAARGRPGSTRGRSRAS